MFAARRNNQYDGVEEFWVDVRTTGSQIYEEKELEREEHKKTKVSDEPLPHVMS